MTTLKTSTIQVNGLAMHVTEAGTGPLAILCHGFPETSHSWRHQIKALAEAGYRAVAPDMRGYGRTDKPAAVEDYTIFHLAGDVIGLVTALGERKAFIIGHDWGAAVAWHVALFRPDLCRGVAAMSVPFQARNPHKKPIETYRAITREKGLGEFYIVRFQEPGFEARFERNLSSTIRSSLYTSSGDVPPDQAWSPFQPLSAEKPLAVPDHLPAWLTEDDIAAYVEAFRLSGFRGPLNWYRNIDRNWELMAPFDGVKVQPPALFITGTRDPVRQFAATSEARLKDGVPNLVASIEIEGAGHWVQQEAADQVNSALVHFLNPLRGG